MQKCTKCNLIKTLDEFYKRKDRKNHTHRTICKNCVSKYMKDNAERNKKHKQKFRLEILQHYSKSETPFCNCCKENTIEFLAIDHINNNGAEHRKTIGNNVQIAYWLKKHNYPEGFQILCHNCNMAKGFYGQCPHTIKLTKS